MINQRRFEHNPIQMYSKFIKFTPLKLLIAISCAIFMVFAWHKLEDGYCIRKGRILTDDEVIIPALLNIVYKNDSTLVKIKDYLISHPNCCSVDRHPSSRTIFDVLTGFNISEVEINYKKVFNADDRNKNYEYYKSFSSVSACGTFIKDEYGTSTPELENAHKIH